MFVEELILVHGGSSVARQVALVRVCASVSHYDSLHVDFDRSGMLQIVIVDGIGQVGHIDTCVTFPGKIEWVFPEDWEH